MPPSNFYVLMWYGENASEGPNIAGDANSRAEADRLADKMRREMPAPPIPGYQYRFDVMESDAFIELIHNRQAAALKRQKEQAA